MPGIFLPFLLDFQKYSNKKQAEIILNEAARLQLEGYKKIGITYSANHGQTANIRRCYQNNIWLTGTQGANQADVIRHVELLLQTPKYHHLQGTFEILPITTIAPTNTLKNYVLNDLNYITQFIRNGKNAVLGWQNQHTYRHNSYAVGGGVSQQLNTEGLNSTVQDYLKNLHASYLAPVNLAPINPAPLNPAPVNLSTSQSSVITRERENFNDVKASATNPLNDIKAPTNPLNDIKAPTTNPLNDIKTPTTNPLNDVKAFPVTNTFTDVKIATNTNPIRIEIKEEKIESKKNHSMPEQPPVPPRVISSNSSSTLFPSSITPSNQTASLQSSAKALPLQKIPTENMKKASNEISQCIKNKEHTKSLPLIRPGNLANTFKIAFDNAADANQFFHYLKTSLKYNVTYFNQTGRELYPMDKEGNVVLDNTQPQHYKDIVRFEVRPGESFPAEALEYLNTLGLSNAAEAFSNIMDISDMPYKDFYPDNKNIL
ncbi:MAG: hypothetical protein JO131_07075 [Gammaproteobacteria bacterium]|nr:hypothetical protein [Gammaproteobacteria bacterium]